MEVYCRIPDFAVVFYFLTWKVWVMGKTFSVKLEKRQRDGIKQMVKDDTADNTSEALRVSIDEGLSGLGYQNGERRDTLLRKTARRLADSTALLGVFWVGLTLFYPLGLRAVAIPIFMVAVGLYGLDRALSRVEPNVSERLYPWGDSA